MTMTVSSDNLILGGFPLLRTTTTRLTQQLAHSLHSGEQQALFFANTNFIVKCQSFREQILASSNVIVNDGVGIDIATWLIHGKKFPENLNGTDFVPQFLQQNKNEARVFLLGAKPGIATRAATTLSNEFGVTIVGCADGYEQARDTKQLIEKINNAQANIILVAMGNPYQEQWIIQHRHQLNVNVLIGVGALLDFLAGDKPRAPRLVQKLRLEWLYRLMLEPTRLIRRYTIDIVIFLQICFRTRKMSLSK